MSTFFSVLGDIFGFMNTWYIFGNISLLHIVLTILFITVFSKLLKGSKDK